MFNINMLMPIAHSEGFGINTDIFETNILNLSVVIGVLIYYGRAVLSDLINNRKDIILKSLQDADNKLLEAEEKLAFAKKNFESAKSKAEQIRNQGTVLSNQTSKTLLDAVEEDIKRLKASNLSTIKFEEENSISEVCQKLSFSAFIKALEKLNKNLNVNFQKKITSQNIEKLSVNFSRKK